MGEAPAMGEFKIKMPRWYGAIRPFIPLRRFLQERAEDRKAKEEARKAYDTWVLEGYFRLCYSDGRDRFYSAWTRWDRTERKLIWLGPAHRDASVYPETYAGDKPFKTHPHQRHIKAWLDGDDTMACHIRADLDEYNEKTADMR